MKVGLIDVDSHNYPNLPLMKLSAYDKANCDRKYIDLQRWCNNRFIFAKCPRFEDYGHDAHEKDTNQLSLLL